MKKIIYFLCLMFLTSTIKAISPVVDYQVGIYSNRIGDKLYSGQMAFIFMDNHIVYCLEPFQLVGKTYYENDTFLSRYDSETIEYFELVAYYGYDSINRNDIYYYMAAQELIWERILGGDYVYWTTEIDGNGNRINIDSYKDEIINNINRYYLKPSFDNKYFSLPFFDTDKIYDSNNIFDTYDQFDYEGNNIVEKNDKGFVVTILEEGKQRISYSKTIKTNNETKVYTGTGNQTLASFGIDKTISGGFSIFGRDYYTNLSVVFYEEESKQLITDVKFEMDSDNELKGKWKNINGKYHYSEPLYEGKYNINVLEEYEVISNSEFEVNKKDLQKETIVNIYLRKKEDNNLKNEIIEDKGEEKLEDSDIGEDGNVIVDDEIQIEDSNKDNNVIEDDKVQIENSIIDNSKKEDLKMKEDIVDIKITNNKIENINDNIETNIIYQNLITNKNELIELPNTYNYNFKKYILLFITFIIGIIIHEKEIRN